MYCYNFDPRCWKRAAAGLYHYKNGIIVFRKGRRWEVSRCGRSRGVFDTLSSVKAAIESGEI